MILSRTSFGEAKGTETNERDLFVDNEQIRPLNTFVEMSGVLQTKSSQFQKTELLKSPGIEEQRGQLTKMLYQKQEPKKEASKQANKQIHQLTREWERALASTVTFIPDL